MWKHTWFIKSSKFNSSIFIQILCRFSSESSPIMTKAHCDAKLWMQIELLLFMSKRGLYFEMRNFYEIVLKQNQINILTALKSIL